MINVKVTRDNLGVSAVYVCDDWLQLGCWEAGYQDVTSRDLSDKDLVRRKVLEVVSPEYMQRRLELRTLPGADQDC